MMEHPDAIDDAPLRCFAAIDHRCQWTGHCLHYRDGRPMGPATFLAICGIHGVFYLKACDSFWRTISETRHLSLNEAKAQAAYEYTGVHSCWETPQAAAPLHFIRKGSLRNTLSADVLWRGEAFGSSGLAKMNREICLRVAHTARVRLDSSPSPSGQVVHVVFQEALEQLRTHRVSDRATIVRGGTPRPEHAFGKRICFTMMETQTVHPDFVHTLNTQYDECWTPTHWNKKTFEASGVQIPIHIVPLGVDGAIFRPGPRAVLPPARLLSTSRAGAMEIPQGFLFISLFQPSFRKGARFLLDSFECAFANTPEVALVLATTTYSQGVVDSLPDARSLNARVYGLSGRFTDHELANVYRACHGYVTGSIGEGWNLPLTEAAACGLAIIAGRHSAHAEIWDDERAYLFEPDGYAPVQDSGNTCVWYDGQPFARFGKGSREQLTSLLKAVWENPSDSQRIGARASEYVARRFNWDYSASIAASLLQR